MAVRSPSARVTVTRSLLVLGFVAFVAFVVWRSLQVAGYQCTLCMSFGGRQMCRTVEGATASEARTSAINNACAHIASGVTDSMACEHGTPVREECRAIN
jgi:hypothetical protein